ncbi:hypothetical protein [Luteimonas salinilitoris]|uniref:Uncharacterized protein n=1 Tax=Luteimonas salinilitoris TaxID=3237697 RepID=A0ABV4HVG6_9GAMM
MRVFMAAVAIGICLGVSFGSLAQETIPSFDVQEVVEQQQEIRRGVESSEVRYRHLSERERRDLLTRQGDLLYLLRDREYQDLSDKQRVEAFNTLEWISAAVNDDGDDNMVCERVKKTGSNRVERVCMTVSERDRIREESRKEFRRRRNQG